MRDYLVTPMTRSRITMRLASSGYWTGKRKGVRMRFDLSNQPTLENSRVQWQAWIDGERQHGKSATVTDAVEEIEIAAAKSRTRK